MADTKVSALAALSGASLASADLFPVVDVSDTSMAASGTDKSVRFDELSGLWVPKSVVTAAGDTIIGTGAGVITNLAIGTVAGKALVADPNATNKASIQHPLDVAHATAGTSGSLAATFLRLHISTVTLSPITTQRLYLCAIMLPKGITVSNITWYSGTTGAATSTNCWAALFDSSRVQKAISADDTAASPWNASTAKTFAMTTPYVTTYAGLHYVGVMVKATTVPTAIGFGGIVTTDVAAAAAPVLCGQPSDTGLTTPASCPSTAGAITYQAGRLYAEVS